MNIPLRDLIGDAAVRDFAAAQTRRQFFASAGFTLGGAALAATAARATAPVPPSTHGSKTGLHAALTETHFPAKAKNVIYLHMVGGPSQMDLFDYKPTMADWYDKDLPASIRNGQRLTTMTSGQARFPIAPSKYKFAQHGKSGAWFSEVIPNKAKMADDLCIVRSMHTEAINHEPAITFMQTGNQVTGRPCLGAWASYGLGSLNQNLPTFVVMVAEPTNKEQIQAISARLWQSGYLSGEHAGVSFRSTGDPILFINNPPGVSTDVRRRTLDGLKKLNEMTFQKVGDPETNTRIQQYEMAFRMQASVPDLTDLSKEDKSTFELYGDAAKKPGSFANTALMARRLVEKGVRFVQIYHNNWDHHGNLAKRMPDQCGDVDRACYGLVQDLKRKGMLDDTLVIWGGEFGRTDVQPGRAVKDELRPGPPPAVLLDVDGRRRREGRHRVRRDGRVQLQHREGPGVGPRLPRDDAAPARHRPRAVHVPLPGSGPEADRRRAGEGHQGLDGVNWPGT